MQEKAFSMMSEETKSLHYRITKKRELDLIPAFNDLAMKECGDLYGAVGMIEQKKD